MNNIHNCLGFLLMQDTTGDLYHLLQYHAFLQKIKEMSGKFGDLSLLLYKGDFTREIFDNLIKNKTQEEIDNTICTLMEINQHYLFLTKNHLKHDRIKNRSESKKRLQNFEKLIPFLCECDVLNLVSPVTKKRVIGNFVNHLHHYQDNIVYKALLPYLNENDIKKHGIKILNIFPTFFKDVQDVLRFSDLKLSELIKDLESTKFVIKESLEENHEVVDSRVVKQAIQIIKEFLEGEICTFQLWRSHDFSLATKKSFMSQFVILLNEKETSKIFNKYGDFNNKHQNIKYLLQAMIAGLTIADYEKNQDIFNKFLPPHDIDIFQKILFIGVSDDNKLLTISDIAQYVPSSTLEMS